MDNDRIIELLEDIRDNTAFLNPRNGESVIDRLEALENRLNDLGDKLDSIYSELSSIETNTR